VLAVIEKRRFLNICPGSERKLLNLEVEVIEVTGRKGLLLEFCNERQEVSKRADSGKRLEM
jgi:hypothetical protein